MRASLRFALSALVAGTLGLSPVLAQKDPPPGTEPRNEAELRALAEKLRALKAETDAKALAEKALAEQKLAEAKRELEDKLRALTEENARKAREAQELAQKERALAEKKLAEAKKALEEKHQKQKNEEDLKALEEKLQQLMKELRDREAHKAKNPEPKPAPPAVPAPPVMLPQPVRPAQPDAKAVLQGLTKHPDPKIAGLATELVERLGKANPPAGVPGLPPISIAPAPGKPIEIELVYPPGIGTRPIEVKPQPPRVIAKEEPKGASSLRMSADGKTAAVVQADGTVVVYDVASGKELMRFPAK